MSPSTGTHRAVSEIGQTSALPQPLAQTPGNTQSWESPVHLLIEFGESQATPWVWLALSILSAIGSYGVGGWNCHCGSEVAHDVASGARYLVKQPWPLWLPQGLCSCKSW